MILVLLSMAHASIELEVAPAVGTEVVVVVVRDGVPGRGETVRVMHRPGTVHERERAIGITDGRGRVTWTPEEGGVAEVRAGTELRAVHIAYSGVPATPLTAIALLLAASLGLVFTGLRRRRRP